ncbi:hypothetical protein EPUL_002300 [Erysiphe pulchra]|uniref:J domain-containing protein n=1 Tax=Erysiphe pulchra TaxID=225359 RepID=A0A2S4PTV6_9PEZI|nr:hypothetical protein EPUL_002300 [Erysiphe pulchra]
MKILTLAVSSLLLIPAVFASWSKEDQEIFRLRHEIEVSEGSGITFYDFLGTKPSASQDEINKAYRKKSRILHPDKVKRQFITAQSSNRKPSQSEIRATAKAASDRFARLGIVSNILRGPGRERYDHFLNNGFPTWKGTGYYYARFRPGLGSVLIGLFIFVGGVGHWITLYLSWKRQRDFINHYISFARHATWGDNIPGLENITGTLRPVATEAQPVNRRQRRMQDKDNKKEKKAVVKKSSKPHPTTTPDSTRARKRVVAENGKTLIVDSAGQVFLEQVDEDGETQEFLLHPDELHKPSFTDTALYRLPIWVYDSIVTRIHPKESIAEATMNEDDVDVDAANSSGDNFELLDNVNKIAENGTSNAIRRKKSQKRK